MCKEVFYISPFNSELTAAIIGQSLAPVIPPGTWGVNEVTFFQNNKVHQDAGSAFQHPDAEPKWDIFDTLGSPFHCNMHLPVTGICLPCHQKPTGTPPVASTALHLTVTGEWMKQPARQLPAMLLFCCWLEKELDYTWHIQGSRGRQEYCMCHRMLFHSAFGQKSIITAASFLVSGFCACRPIFTSMDRLGGACLSFQKAAKWLLNNACPSRKPP